jgi:hypothetical protein
MMLPNSLTNRLIERACNSEMRFPVQFLQDLSTEPELLDSSIVLDTLAFAGFLRRIGIWQVFGRWWVDLTLRPGGDCGFCF